MKHTQPLAVTLPEMGQKIRGGEGSEGSTGPGSSQAPGEGPWHLLVRGHCSQKDLGITGKEEFILVLLLIGKVQVGRGWANMCFGSGPRGEQQESALSSEYCCQI